MTAYELSYIVSPEITSEEAEAKAKEFEALVQSKEGVIVKQNNPVAKTLAYPIKKRASGFFGVLEFQLEPEKMVEIKEVIEKDKKIVRHMIVIKRPAKPIKERRSRTKTAPTFEIEKKTEEVAVEAEKVEEKIEEQKEEKPAHAKVAVEKEKVELKDIEDKLDEILGE